MKINNAFLTLILCISSLSVWGQSDNLSVVRNNYPEVYASILQSTGQQWDDPQVKQTVMEGQAKAFLALAESQKPMDSGMLAEAILNNSLPGMKEYNTRILNDLSIENPFPLLKCDWFKAQAYYDRRVASQYATSTSNPAGSAAKDYTAQTLQKQQEVSPETRDYDYTAPQTQQRNSYMERPRNTQKEPDTPDTGMYTSPVETDNNPQYSRNRNDYNDNRDFYSDEYNGFQDQRYSAQQAPKKESPFHLGIKIGGGLGSMYNMGSYLNRHEEHNIPANLQVKSRMGLLAEGGLAFMYKSKGFFVQNETEVQYSQANFTSKIYSSAFEFDESKFNDSYLFLQTAFHIGGYYEIDEGVHLIAGVGPYIGFRLNSTYDDNGFALGGYKKYMKAGEKSIEIGASGVFGVDIHKFRIALYPSIGLTKMYETEEYKPFGATLGFTYWFF